MIKRGDLWWAELDAPQGSAPGFRRPVLIVQSDALNRSRIPTVIAVAVTTNLRLLDAPGNVLLRARESGLTKDSVANVSQIVTIDRQFLGARIGEVGGATLTAITRGLKTALDL